MSTQPSDIQKRIWYNALTALCVTLMGVLLVSGIWLTGEVLAYLQPVLVPLAVAGILAYLIDPVVSWLGRKGMSRLQAILLFFLVSLIGMSIFLFLIGKPLKAQFETLEKKTPEYVSGAKQMAQEFGQFEALSKYLPFLSGTVELQGEEEGANSTGTESTETESEGAVQEGSEAALDTGEPQGQQSAPPTDEGKKNTTNSSTLEQWGSLLSVDKLMDSIEKNAPSLAKRITEAVTRGATKFFGILGYLLGFLMVPIYLFFFLKESDKIKRNWRSVVPLRASKLKDEVVTTLTEINDYLIAFFRGQVLVSLIDGVLVGLALVLFQHPYGILLGISLAFLGIIPFIGNVICLVPASVTAYTHFSVAENQYWGIENPWVYVLIVVGLFLVVQQINSLVTAPKIVGDSVGLHPMTVIFSLIFWSLLLGGFLGALLAVPMTASVKVLFKRYVWERKVFTGEASPAT